ncbi:hypothetical protein [Marivita sp. GX14005]|uniref:hypothetical protein n=1 Tax=Marivita sp. GX14005 TaxID=2942276 RepID=UPI0020195E7D|nr:hypothetical protein [Marivita sp. GX14005]MCL3883294.1 hypothetical protein [Marivita sp. GX14005]
MTHTQEALIDLAAQHLADFDLAGELGLGPSEIAAGLCAAEADLDAGRSAEAAVRFAVLALLDPGAVGPQAGLCRCAMAEGRFEVAMNTAARIVMLHPARGEGFLLLGLAAAAMGETDAAIEDFQSALDRAPDGSALADAARGGLAAAQARRAS